MTGDINILSIINRKSTQNIRKDIKDPKKPRINLIGLIDDYREIAGYMFFSGVCEIFTKVAIC